MRFWDTSAVVPLVVREATTALVQGWLVDDQALALWALTRVELVSAVERRTREGMLDAATRTSCLATAKQIADGAHEIADLASVRIRAALVLARYPLRAAHALQLGAALTVAEPDPSAWTFVVLDRRLADAAAREGFKVLTVP